MASILVAYASKNNSTAEIAEAIARALRESGNDARTGDVAEGRGPSPDGYDAVVLGSAVYMGRWRRGATRYLHRNRAALGAKPFWLFSSGPVQQQDQPAAGDGAASRGNWLEPARVIELAASLGVREHVVFGGRLPDEPHGFIEAAMARNAGADGGDMRDWQAIREWARGIASQLADDRLGT